VKTAATAHQPGRRAVNSAAEFGLRMAYPGIWGYLADVRRTQWLSPAEVQRVSWTQLKATLDYAYLNVPFYREKFQSAGILPDDVCTPADMRSVPITTKDELRQALQEQSPLSLEFSPRDVKPLSTTGSTGKPLLFSIDREAKQRRMATLFRNIEWYGHYLGDRNARIWGWGQERLPWWRVEGFRRRLETEVLGRRIELVTHDYASARVSYIDELKLGRWCERLRRYQPKVLDGYVSALTLLARYVIEHKIDDIRCAAIVTGGEYLSSSARALLADAFGCPVFNRYGGNEAGTIAHECGGHPQHKLHINAESVWLEIVKDGEHVSRGEWGDIVVTDFTNHATPLIRYRVEDVGIAASTEEICPCGRGLPLLTTVEGRINDLFHLPDGGVVVSHVWHDLFLTDFVRDFQLIQRRTDLVEVNVAINRARASSAELQDLKRRVAECLPGCELVWREVDRLTPGAGGKRRHSMSEVPSELNGLRAPEPSHLNS
jgi:phenylacetate-CoA ligase